MKQRLRRHCCPLIYQAICATYKLSEQSALVGNALLDRVSKAAVADCLYDLLPNVIGGIPVGIVKTWVSRVQFAQLVESLPGLTPITTPGWKTWTRHLPVGSKPISQSSSAAMCSRSNEALE